MHLISLAYTLPRPAWAASNHLVLAVRSQAPRSQTTLLKACLRGKQARQRPTGAAMRVTAAALLAAFLVCGVRASEDAALGSVLVPVKPGEPHLVDSVHFSTLAGGDSGSDGSALAAGPSAGSRALDITLSVAQSNSGSGGGSSDGSSETSSTGSDSAFTFGSSALQEVPGVDIPADAGAALDTSPGLTFPASTQSIQGAEDSFRAANAQEALPDYPASILGGSAGSGAARQLRGAAALNLAVTEPWARGSAGRRLQQGDPRVDRFAYGGYGGVPGSASSAGITPNALGGLGSRRRLAQFVNPGQVPSNPFQFALSNVPGLPDMSPFAQGSPGNPAVKGAYGGGRRRLQAGPASHNAQAAVIPDFVSMNQLPVSSTEGNALRRRRRVRSTPAADPNPVRDTPASEGRPAGRRLAQFVPLHGGSSGVDSGVVAPGLFRPSGSYSRRH